jgi:hypothetical protein
MDGGDCTLCGGSWLSISVEFGGAERAMCGVGRLTLTLEETLPFLEVFQRRENGEGVDASLRFEELGFRDANNFCCRSDHDEFECCCSPE